MTDQPTQPDELDLRSYLQPVWRRRWLVLAIVVVAAVATYLISSSEKKTYESSTRVYVQVADPTLNLQQGTQVTPTPLSLADVAQLMTAQSVVNAVGRSLGIPASAAGSVVATASTNSDFVNVTATSSSPQLAARLANAYVSQFLVARQQAVRSEALRDESAASATLSTIPKTPANVGQRETVLQQIETYREIALSPTAGARQIDSAAVPGVPSSPKPTRDALFGGVVGLVLAVIIAFCLELLDRRLVRVSTVEAIYGRHVLAVLPHVDDPTPANHGRLLVPPQFVEELRTLRVMLRLAGDAPPRTIVVTSTMPQEGKSTITRDLALVHAEAGDRVLAIDGDLRRPNMNALFGAHADAGLVQVLRGERSLSDVVAPVVVPGQLTDASNGHGPAEGNGAPTYGGAVDLLAHGQQLNNPLPLLASDRMLELLREAARSYDVVLVDTPPVLAVADSVPLLEVVDSVLLVARLGQTTRDAASRFNELVARLSDVNFSGVIANDRTDELDDEGYGSYARYGYGYGYGYGHRPRFRRLGRKQKAPTPAA